MNNYDERIANIISEEHNNLKGIYGTLRLKYHIQNKYKNERIILNHKRIRRYKKELNLAVVVRKRKPLSVSLGQERTIKNKAEYLIKGDFNSTEFGSKHSSDVSYIECSDGTLYLSAVKDLFNNEVTSFSCSNRNNIDLILDSYKNINITKDTVINTDQGAVYFAYEYINLAKELGFTRSMSRKGRCWENSPIENWFSQLKEEWLRPLGTMTRQETYLEIKKYVKWYNTERIQKDLGYLSPLQYRLNF